jgi:ABC-type ATPase with predicted acetyltransferase domain
MQYTYQFVACENKDCEQFDVEEEIEVEMNRDNVATWTCSHCGEESQMEFDSPYYG